MSDLLKEAPVECLAPLAALVAVLQETRVVPASINVEWRHTDQTHPYLNVWLRYRTDMERVASALSLRVVVRAPMSGQRHYSTRGDDPGVLLQAMSFEHHDDYLATMTGEPS